MEVFFDVMFVEARIKTYSQIKFKNLSDGVLITGAEPIRHTDYASSQPTDDIKELDTSTFGEFSAHLTVELFLIHGLQADHVPISGISWWLYAM